jgi:hypothetical protein
MADRREPIRKSPAEILDDLVNGHREAMITGVETAKKYLLKFRDRNDSLPNAVKFFLYDLLVESAYQTDDMEACQQAVTEAARYLPVARADLPQQFRGYSTSIRMFERGIALALDEGEFERGLALCNQAIALDLGPAYQSKRASIERML